MCKVSKNDKAHSPDSSDILFRLDFENLSLTKREAKKI